MKNMLSSSLYGEIIKITGILAIAIIAIGCSVESDLSGDGDDAGNENGFGATSVNRNVGNIGDVDVDDDGLIEIDTLERLYNIRYNLEGTSYKTSESDVGNASGCPSSGCVGYELTASFDFDEAASYASGEINPAWRPKASTSDYTVETGWLPIGSCNEDTDEVDGRCGDDDDEMFAAIFEGNGYTITGLYTNLFGGIGLFSATTDDAEIRNVGLVDVSIVDRQFGSDTIGALVGFNNGTIIASFASGTIDGGKGNDDRVGGLVGVNAGEIIASRAAVAVNSGDGIFGAIGGLVGWNDGGTIASSYATGVADGGAGGSDAVGGLVGWNDGGTIVASYATGGVSGGVSDFDAAGGLVGVNDGTIVASYAVGGVDGDEGDSEAEDGGGLLDAVGRLVGIDNGTIAASYGFGFVTNGETSGVDRSDDADDEIYSPARLTAATSSTETANRWSDDVWNFVDDRRYPILKWTTRYDSDSQTFACEQARLPAGSTCGSPLPDQYDVDDDGMQDTVLARPNPPTLEINGPEITIEWDEIDGANGYRVYRNINVETDVLDYRPIAEVPASGATTNDYIDIDPLPGRSYYAVSAINNSGEGERSASVSTSSPMTVDADGDGLIEINSLEELYNIRHNLDGTSYKSSNTAIGNATGCPDGRCIGYELMQDLDFEEAASYDSGTVRSAWTAGGTGDGWTPIGTAFNAFGAVFEGNDNTITNLFSRSFNYSPEIFTNIYPSAGLFGTIGESATIRNVGLLSGDIAHNADRGITYVGMLVGYNFGGTIIASHAAGMAAGGAYLKAGDCAGGLVGLNSGTIIASHASVSVTNTRSSTGSFGGLVGWNESGTIIASYATGSVYSEGPGDNLGGLVGWNNSGTIIASYATGTISTTQQVDAGGLVGSNRDGTIIASYATGAVDGAGGSDDVGGLVGWNSGTITASYATGAVDGGGGVSDRIGSLVGNNTNTNMGTIFLSYGFGAVMGEDAIINTEGELPGGVTTANELLFINAWNSDSRSTRRAWDFGTAAQSPALRYADYDGDGAVYDCDMFPDTLPDGSPLICGTTLIPGQRE